MNVVFVNSVQQFDDHSLIADVAYVVALAETDLDEDHNFAQLDVVPKFVEDVVVDEFDVVLAFRFEEQLMSELVVVAVELVAAVEFVDEELIVVVDAACVDVVVDSIFEVILVCFENDIKMIFFYFGLNYLVVEPFQSSLALDLYSQGTAYLEEADTC